jgi:C_GCAxxG_C_C family probable redox protein
METKAEIAAEDYFSKFNCAQSVLAVFVEEYDADMKTMLRLGASFGGGCHFGGTCGAVMGAIAVIGLKYGNDEPDPDKYLHNREKVREFMTLFKGEFDTVSCSELLGIDMEDPSGREKAKEQQLFKTRCKKIVFYAVELLEEIGY